MAAQIVIRTATFCPSPSYRLVTEILPLFPSPAGLPSLNINVLNANVEFDPFRPTTRNLRLSKIPVETIEFVPYTAKRSLPGWTTFVTTERPSLKDPDRSAGVVSGWMTLGS